MPILSVPARFVNCVARDSTGPRGACQNGASLGRRDHLPSRHGRHRLEYAASSDERMEKRRRDMEQDEGKEHKSKVEVRILGQRMQAVDLR